MEQFTPADVTVIVVNFRTATFTEKCYRTFRAAYPSAPIILIDNGSEDESTRLIEDLAKADPATQAMLLPANIFHGPAMDIGIRHSKTRFVFILDSDTEVIAGGFLERMLAFFAEDDRVYAVGEQGWTNRLGYAPISVDEQYTAYIHPFASLIDKTKYVKLAPFIHHGAPCYRNMWAARKAGYKLQKFPIGKKYIHHFGKVTASKFGYGYNRSLQLQRMLNTVDHKLRRGMAKLSGKALRAPEYPSQD